MTSPYYRGSYRGRGRGVWQGYPGAQGFNAARATSGHSSSGGDTGKHIKENLVSAPLETVSIPYAPGREFNNADLLNVEYVGSYNWVDEEKPTIIVPGSPPVWTDDRRPPFVLSPDSGMSFADQNGSRMPLYPLLPLFVAVDTVASSSTSASIVDWPTIDFVTDRNGLRKLMRWIDGTASRDFRIDLELAGKKTILMNRWDNKQKEEARGNTYGLEFEKATTRAAKGCERGAGHHRIIQYDFCGLKMVVRFEVDACLPISPAVRSMTRAGMAKSGAETNADDLADALAGLNIVTTPSLKSTAQKEDIKAESRTNKPEKASPSPIKVLTGGTEVPQDAIMELTTRSQRNVQSLNWGDIFPQLFLSATPNFYIGVHEKGRFTEIRKMEMSGDELSRQKEEADVSFRKLGKALKIIQEIAQKYGKARRVSLVCEGGVLKVYERRGGQSCLPDGSEGVGRFN